MHNSTTAMHNSYDRNRITTARQRNSYGRTTAAQQRNSDSAQQQQPQPCSTAIHHSHTAPVGKAKKIGMRI